MGLISREEFEDNRRTALSGESDPAVKVQQEGRLKEYIKEQRENAIKERYVPDNGGI